MKLLKTNSRIYTDRLNAYLLSNISHEDFDIELTDRDKIEFLLLCFRDEYDYEYNRRMYPNKQNRLAQWLMGLPSCTSFAFSNYDILELARSLHGVNELSERQESVILANYFNHLAFHLLKIANKLNVNI